MTGQTVALEGKQPKICYEGRLVPICGHYFWDNNFGARLFCQMLGRSGGIVSQPRFASDVNFYIVGKCSSTDTHITSCSAGANTRTLGGKAATSNCNKGAKAGAYISCDGKIFPRVMS